MKEIITIQISRFLTDELAEKIAQKHWKSSEPKWVNRSRQLIFDEMVINGNDCFDVVASGPDQDLIGRLHCIKNESDPKLWYYGDLFVVPEYRRMGIAARMIRAAMGHLSEMGAAVLRCYVEPENTASRKLQLSVGFLEQPYQTFNDIDNEGQAMYEAEISPDITMIPATVEEAYFVRILFVQNREVLHTDNISLAEWRELLAVHDPDERHFLICKGAVPVAYLRINGLEGGNEAWISMLFVARGFQRQGIGSFAVKNVEGYVRERGFKSIAVQTDEDNLPAQGCYLKCGYRIFGQGSKVRFRKML